MRTITIGFLGCGNIGSGVWRLIHDFAPELIHREQVKFYVKRVLVRDVKKRREVDLPAEILTDRPEDVLDDPEIEMIVEFMGGEQPATDYMLRALENGKTVITANKMALALNWNLLQSAAVAHGSGLYYEAAVCGAIPIIRTITDSLEANSIQSLMGIVNGTTNYILTKMSDAGESYGDVLREAQATGLAEPDPSSDVEGYDAAYKLSILASLAFHACVPFEYIYREGITGVEPMDIALARDMGYTLKLLAIAKRDGNVIEARVHPTFIKKEHPLSSVNGSFNAIFLRGHACEDMMLLGRGAGSAPTSSAVVSDMLFAARQQTPRNPTFINNHHLAKELTVTDNWHCGFYIRLTASDRAGVLGQIANCLGEHNVSIKNLIQRDPGKDGSASVVIITHAAGERDVKQALAAIDPASAVIRSLIRVEV